MNRLFDYIDANPDCLVGPFLLLLLASFIAGLWYEGKKLDQDRNRSRKAAYIYMIAGCLVCWTLSLYIGLLIYELWR